jgi:peptidoglycan/LPS O-acetylase OafA/YrhL
MKHQPQLDGLRALAVLMVLAHHVFHAPVLWAGVDLFFVLSGYLITGILLRDCERMSFGGMLGNFYLRRAQRILPAYVLFLAIAALFVGAELRALWPYYAGFAQNVPYAFGRTPTPLTPLWSLAVEQHFYLVWPVLVYFAPRRWLGWILGAIVVAEPLLRFACTPLFHSADAIYMLTPFRLDTMALGALAALLLPRVKAANAMRWSWVAMAGGVVAYGLLAHHHPWFHREANSAVFNALGYTLNLAVMGGLFVWLVAAPESWAAKLLAWRPLRGLGRISYMFYLLHVLVMVEVEKHVRSGAAVFVLTLAIAAGLATVSWLAWERPILRLGKRAGKKQLVAAGVAAAPIAVQ